VPVLTAGAWALVSETMDVLTNPYFLGYVLVVLVLVRFGNMLKATHRENVAKRAAEDAARRESLDIDV